jgi:hypothetical protein
MQSWAPRITPAIACVSVFFACVAPADAVQLVTEQEAGYPDDPYGIERGGPTPGPEVEVVSPALSGLVKSPFYLKIKFKRMAARRSIAIRLPSPIRRFPPSTSRSGSDQRFAPMELTSPTPSCRPAPIHSGST